MSELTPGSWRVEARVLTTNTGIRFFDGYLITDANGGSVALAHTATPKADVLRMAAAREMEKALEGLMRMSFEDLSGEESGTIIEAALVALAKAKGE